ncbi:MAG TPA: AMP-binding protein [Gaiellaceae bacterium]|nr:AMP-binding protein [Gaiellaceae bacterium]
MSATTTWAWTPSAEQLEAANVSRLARALGCADYDELHRLSVEEPDRFWRAVVADLDLALARPWERVLDESRGIEWTTWFEGARLNIATACVHAWAERTPDAPAAVFAPEEGAREEWTFAELSERVTRLAEALAALGVEAGDRVALYLPMCPDVAVASHACAHLGAVQVPIFSGFAAPAVVQRLRDAEAKVVLTADWSFRRGRRVPMRETIEEALASAPSVQHVVEWSRADREWQVELGPGELPPLEVDAEHPYLLAYTSGTTGRPKGALHVHGGFLLSIAREVAYQSDVRAGDRVLFATDMGWIMGPWTVVGAGALGAAVVYLEGAPDRPDDRLWRLVEAERLTMLGLSPTLTRALIPKGEPRADLSSLRAVTTTGEPWNAGPYDWLNEHVAGGGRIPIVNISGGTEVGACFLSVTPMRPTKPVSLGFPALGEAMDVYGPDGRPVRGEVGELVCTRPWPGMTRGIWGDDERYLETYWPLPRRLDARRLGLRGRGRLLVPARALRRHAQRRREADRPCGARVGRPRPPLGRRGGGGRDPARGEGRGAVAVRRAEAGGGAGSGGDRRGRGRLAREGVRAGAGGLRERAPEDAQREDRAARRPGARARRGPRRPLDPGESRRARGDRTCRLGRSSPEAAEASARTSPARSRARAGT